MRSGRGRRGNPRNLHHTDPLDRGDRILPGPTLSHDPSTDIYSPSERGLSQTEIDGIATVQYADEGEVECMCSEKVRRSQAVKVLPCGHVFHARCITQALARTSRCPFDGTEAI